MMTRKLSNSGSIIAALLVLSLWSGSAAAIPPDDASKYIYGFRKDNQFSLLLSFARHEWELTATDSFDADSLAMQLLYRFQLQLVQNFGYYFGTCLGVRYFFPATRSNFHTWLLPGATAGFIWYVNAEWQILLGVEIFLERVPSLPTKDGEVSVLNLESYGATLTVERYFTLNTAIVANLSANTVLHEMQRKDSAQVSDLHRRDVRVALGINYHLL